METSITTIILHTPMGFVTRDGEGHDKVYAKKPQMNAWPCLASLLP
ncbi:hypothetical protein SynROS8604_03675 [Synechococcus sp. ROS8604]|nr:hypothetical protein SynROS8604_03675 [Synechococcus sp. ROS8604]